MCRPGNLSINYQLFHRLSPLTKTNEVDKLKHHFSPINIIIAIRLRKTGLKNSIWEKSANEDIQISNWIKVMMSPKTLSLQERVALRCVRIPNRNLDLNAPRFKRFRITMSVSKFRTSKGKITREKRMMKKRKSLRNSIRQTFTWKGKVMRSLGTLMHRIGQMSGCRRPRFYRWKHRQLTYQTLKTH